MKNTLFFVISAFMLLSFAANAQIAKDSIVKHLPGIWKLLQMNILKYKRREDQFLAENIRFQTNTPSLLADKSANRDGVLNGKT